MNARTVDAMLDDGAARLRPMRDEDIDAVLDIELRA